MHRDEDDDLSPSSSEDTDVSDEEQPKQSRKAPAASLPKKKKKKSKKSQPGRYSQLVIDTIRRLGERNGSSLARIFNESKKVPWFDQQNGRTYLRYSIKALVQNDTLLQVKGTGANGSFRLNRRKLEGHAEPAAPKSPPSPQKKSHKKKKQPSGDEPKKSHKKQLPDPAASPPKKSHKKKSSKKEKSAKVGMLKMPKSKKA
ncbi:hypothetical protein NDU88_008267 [Pleurodeles waltl]|uniref:H15 domain-containing protein n=2 Tax=Pleurodeles waltl TaxID=8319 RepID=A0AAV7N5W5_PLEWA|nr:hypothetical protein NDU88_008267 [Pleurodeles waltl]